MAAAEKAYDAFAACKSELAETERTHESPVYIQFQPQPKEVTPHILHDTDLIGSISIEIPFVLSVQPM